MGITATRTLTLAAIGLLLAGCASPGGGSAQDPQPAQPGPQAASTAGSQSGNKQASGSESSDQGGAAGSKESVAKPPKTAEAAIKAEAKNLSAAEQKFVAAVDEPEVYPAAVMEAGQEACDRLAYLAKADPGIVPGALATGDIPDAVEAVAHLCPEFGPQLKQAEGGFKDGTVGVAGKAVSGKSITAGSYKAVSPADSCSWQVVDKAGKVLAAGSMKDGDAAKLKVPAGAASVSTTGCYAWVPVQ